MLNLQDLPKRSLDPRSSVEVPQFSWPIKLPSMLNATQQILVKKQTAGLSFKTLFKTSSNIPPHRKLNPYQEEQEKALKRQQQQTEDLCTCCCNSCGSACGCCASLATNSCFCTSRLPAAFASEGVFFFLFILRCKSILFYTQCWEYGCLVVLGCYHF